MRQKALKPKQCRPGDPIKGPLGTRVTSRAILILDYSRVSQSIIQLFRPMLNNDPGNCLSIQCGSSQDTAFPSQEE